jgi:hypothetical protein
MQDSRTIHVTANPEAEIDEIAHEAARYARRCRVRLEYLRRQYWLKRGVQAVEIERLLRGGAD